MKFDKVEQRDIFRWGRLRGAKLVGKFDMPALRPVTESADPHDLVPFNAAMTEAEPEKKWYHFYIDDYSKPIPKLLKSSIIEKWHTQLIIVNALWNIVKRDIP